MTNFRPLTGKLVKVYAGRCDAQNRIEEGRGPLRWDKTSCRRFAADQARLLMGVLAYVLLQVLRQLSLIGEEVNQSVEWLIKLLIKAGDRVSYHARRWHVHAMSVFPLNHDSHAVFG